MKHLTDGVLRRIQDEPAMTAAADSRHLAECAECRARAAHIEVDALAAAALLSSPVAAVEPALALLRLRRAAGDSPAREGSGWVTGLRRRRAFRPAAASLLTLGLLGGLVATGLAEKAVQVFQPKSFAVVTVDPQSLGSLPDLSQFGTYKVPQQPSFKTAHSAAEALAGSGLSHLLTPGAALPSVVKGAPVFETFSKASGSFTFSAAMARQYAAAHGKTLPAMPAGIDGTTLSASAGPGVLEVYGAPTGLPGDATAADAAATAAPNAAAHSKRPGGISIPSLAIVQMTSPTVVSDGASVQALESYLTSLPGVPADLAAQLQALGDPASTLPVPVPTGQGSHQVDINGASGLFVGDSTGLGSGVIWQKGGTLYAVVGTLTETEVVAVARGLH